MGKRSTALLFMFFISAVPAVSALGTRTVRKQLLPDGFLLAGADGKLITQDSNDRWFFEFDSGIGDDKTRLPAGTAIELLPSSRLEKMTADMKEPTSADYRLWGKVTKYKGKNFIFPTYFLLLGKAVQQKTQQPQPQSINEPNDVLLIPNEVVNKLTGRRIIRTEQLEKGLELKADSILADRIGFIHDSGHEISFVLDAFGRNTARISFGLLPCQASERAQRQQSNQPEPVRFKIAGIVTKYKGRYYLLLQRATRIYSHGNFGI